MILAIALLLGKWFGWDTTRVQKWLILGVMVLVGVFTLMVVTFVFRACTRPPKLDEKQIQKAEQAVKDRNDRVLKQILAESDTRIERIDSNIKLAEEATRNAVKSYDNYTLDELAAEIERRKNQ